ILFELLTGTLPFAGRETMDILLAHATEEPPSFAGIGASGLVPPAIERVVRMCLAKLPDERPRHARELSELSTEALGHSQMGMTPAPAPTAPSSRGAKLRPVGEGPATVPTVKPRVVTLQPLASSPTAPPPAMTAAAEPVVLKAPT